jgi:N-acetylmuramoyl-L-alanine amidase
MPEYFIIKTSTYTKKRNWGINLRIDVLTILFFILFELLSLSAYALEIGVSQVSNGSCTAKIKGYNKVNLSESGVKISFSSSSAQPIIFNNCNFVILDKKKREVMIYNGKVASSTGCQERGVCTISFKAGDGSIDSFFTKVENMEADVDLAKDIKFIKKEKSDDSHMLVVLDAGHGGKDPGAIGKNGSREKDITLKYAKYIKSHLEKAGYRVYLTREKDEYLKLHERIDVAMSKNAAIFISIHADSAANSKVRGVTIYTLAPNAVNNATKSTEARTNISGNFVQQVVDEDLIFNILNIQHNSNVRQAFAFSHSLIENMKARKIKFTSIPIRSADFAVLKAPTFPAILLELGYISNSDDERMLRSASYMKNVSEAILETLEQY